MSSVEFSKIFFSNDLDLNKYLKAKDLKQDIYLRCIKPIDQKSNNFILLALASIVTKVLKISKMFIYLITLQFSSFLTIFKSYLFEIENIFQSLSTGPTLLMPAKNILNEKARKFLEQTFENPTNISSTLLSQKLKKNFKASFFDLENFDGICKGIAYLFLYFYLKLEKKGLDKDKIILEISKKFTKGAPLQASILQTFGFYLDFQKRASYSLDIFNFDEKKEFVINSLKNLKNGAYKTTIVSKNIFSNKTFGHLISIIKISNNKYYIFDPNIGLLEKISKFPEIEIYDYLNSYINSNFLYTFINELLFNNFSKKQTLLSLEKKDVSCFKKHASGEKFTLRRLFENVYEQKKSLKTKNSKFFKIFPFLQNKEDISVDENNSKKGYERLYQDYLLGISKLT